MPVAEVSTYEDFKSVLLDSNDDKHGKKYVFVDFFAQWCGPCKRFAPVLDELSDTYGENVFYMKVDIDEVDQAAMDYDITGLPTFMVFETGKLETEFSKIVGASKDAVESKLKQLEAGPVEPIEDF